MVRLRISPAVSTSCACLWAFTGKQVTLEVRASVTIEAMKRAFEDAEQLPVDQQLVVVDGRRLEVGRTLQCFHIQRARGTRQWLAGCLRQARRRSRPSCASRRGEPVPCECPSPHGHATALPPQPVQWVALRLLRMLGPAIAVAAHGLCCVCLHFTRSVRSGTNSCKKLATCAGTSQIVGQYERRVMTAIGCQCAPPSLPQTTPAR